MRIEHYKIIRMYECVFEAVPQGVLQLVFTLKILQSENTENYNLTMLILSLIGSLYSIMNRFVSIDKNIVIDTAKSLDFDEKS